MNEELRKILEENSLSEYIEVLEREKLLTVEDLKSLSQDDYKELGINALGDRKKFLKLFADNSSSQTEIINAVVVQDDEEYINTTRRGRKLCYKTSNPNHFYCPKCHSSVNEDASLCWNCNEDLVDKNYIVPTESSFQSHDTLEYSKTADSPHIVINNAGEHSSAAHTGLAGVLGGIIGAVAVIVIILIILSNESWSFTL